jgi:iron-sulfur cluster assembly accessory protein
MTTHTDVKEAKELASAIAVTDEEHGVKLTSQAATKTRNLLEIEGRTDLRLRVQVSPGGCSGLIYGLHFDDRVLDGDAIMDFDGLEVIVDKMSAPYLGGAIIDFEDTISKQGFAIDNPNAGGSCACGDSFH